MQAFLVLTSGIAFVHVQDTDQFCHQTLCDPTFVHYVSENFLCWGGDVRKTDAFTVSLLKLPVLLYSSSLHSASQLFGCLQPSFIPACVELHSICALPESHFSHTFCLASGSLLCSRHLQPPLSG